MAARSPVPPLSRKLEFRQCTRETITHNTLVRTFSFLWVKTFKLSIYGPAILPLMAVYIALAMEAIGE